MSKEEEGEITLLKITQARMEEKIDTIVLGLKEIKDEKADKWVESAMKWLIGATFTLDFSIVLAVITWWLNKH